MTGYASGGRLERPITWPCEHGGKCGGWWERESVWQYDRGTPICHSHWVCGTEQAGDKS